MDEEQETAVHHVGLRSIVDIFDRFTATARAAACFGEPMQVGEKTIIPTSEIMCTMVFGLGAGGAGNSAGQAEGADESTGKMQGTGSGGGGGGFTRSRPVAVVVVSPDGVSVEPVVDATQIAMAGVAAGAFVGFWLIRLMRGVDGGRVRGKGPSLRSLVSSIKNV